MNTIKSLLTILVSLLIIIFIIPLALVIMGVGGVSIALFGDVVIIGLAIIGVVVLVKAFKKK